MKRAFMIFAAFAAAALITVAAQAGEPGRKQEPPGQSNSASSIPSRGLPGADAAALPAYPTTER